MIRINLIRERRGAGAKKKAVVAGAPSEGLQPLHIAAILIVLLGVGYVGFNAYRLNAELTRRQNEKAELEREKQKLQPIIKKKEELERKRQELDRKIGIIKDLKKRQQGPVRMLDALSRNLPDDVWFSEMSERDFQISIKGNARNPNKLADFIDNLVHSGSFQSVELSQYTEATGSVSFLITAHFKLPEAPATNGVTPK